MSMQGNLLGSSIAPQKDPFAPSYLNSLSLVGRLHRLFLDVLKDEFQRAGSLDVNAVQAQYSLRMITGSRRVATAVV